MSDASSDRVLSIPKSGSAGVWRTAGVVGIATFISRILGLVREQVIAVLFGAGDAADAFNVAFRIPNLLRNLFAEGAMSASLVPVFTRTRLEQGDSRAWRVAGLVFRILFVTVGGLAFFGVLFAEPLVGLFAGAFKNIPGKYEMTVSMTRIMFPYFPLVALAAAFMGILNACGVFFLPALSAALFNVASVLVGVVFVKWVLPSLGWGMEPISGMAFGVVIGGAVQAFCQLPSLYRVGYRWQGLGSGGRGSPPWYRDPSLKSMLWMMIPGTIGLAATQVNILVNTILATSQEPGAVSWLSYAFRLIQFPIGIFGVSLGTATLPRVSELWVRRDVEGIKNTLGLSLRRLFAINLPASAGLAFLGVPIIRLIFQYGRFHAEDTGRTARALAMYALGLTAYSTVKILVPACYALGNTRIPVISSLVAVLTGIILSFSLAGPFGYWGLALATSLGAILNAIFLLIAIQKLLRAQSGDLPLFELFHAFWRNLAIALMMGVACYLSCRALEWGFPDRLFLELSGGNFEYSLGRSLGALVLPVSRGVKVGVVVLEGIALVFLLARVFRLEETEAALKFFTQKLKKKLSRQTN